MRAKSQGSLATVMTLWLDIIKVGAPPTLHSDLCVSERGGGGLEGGDGEGEVPQPTQVLAQLRERSVHLESESFITTQRNNATQYLVSGTPASLFCVKKLSLIERVSDVQQRFQETNASFCPGQLSPGLPNYFSSSQISTGNNNLCFFLSPHLFPEMEFGVLCRTGSRQVTLELTLSAGTEKCLRMKDSDYRFSLHGIFLDSDLCMRWRMISQHTSFLACTPSLDPAPCLTHNTASLIEPSSNLLNSDLSPQSERNSATCSKTKRFHPPKWKQGVDGKFFFTSALSAGGPMVRIEKA